MAKESLQKKTGPGRHPRVQIVRDVEIDGAIQKRDLPFVVGVFADLSGQTVGQPLPISQRRFAAIDRDNLDDVLASIAPRVAFQVPNHLDRGGAELHVELSFQSMNDFAPDRIANQIAELRSLLGIRSALRNLKRTLITREDLEDTIEEISRDPESLKRAREELQAFANQSAGTREYLGSHALASRLVASARIRGNAPEETAAFVHWLSVLFDEIVAGTILLSDDLDRTISERVKAIDELASREMDEVMHSEPTQKLEASWRGLQYLVQQSETSSQLKIKVFNVSKMELIEDLSRAGQVEKTAVFERIRGESYGSSAELFGAFIGDFEFGGGPADVGLLQELSELGAWWNAPFISAAAPAMLHFESFTELAEPRDLGKIFDNPIYARWHNLRKSEDARYLGLCLPRVLMRVPYGGTVVEEFDYRESVPNHAAYLWGNAAYSFAARLTNAFAEFGWCASIRGVEGGGLVEGLPIAALRTDHDELVLKCPTEIAITDRRESELATLGFIPLCYYKGTGHAVFMTAPSVQKSQLYMDDDANANAWLSTQLPYIFACSRFAHLMKALVKEKIGGFRSPADCEAFLNRWISQYLLLDDVASLEARAKFPLREARVDVSAGPNESDVLRAVVFLRPHFQLDEMAVSLRLVVPLPSIAIM